MDRRRVKERTVAGRELKISYGGWPGGSAPCGYRIEKDTKEVDGRRKRLSVLVTDAHESMSPWSWPSPRNLSSIRA